MDDVFVLEAAHQIDDAVGLAYVREELVAEALAFGRAGDETRDVHELHRRRRHLGGAGNLRDLLQRGSGTGTTPTFGSIVQNG